MHLHAAGLHIHTFWIQNSEILFWTVLLLSDSSAPVIFEVLLSVFSYILQLQYIPPRNNQPPLPFPSPAYLSVFRNLHTYHRLQGTHSNSFQVLWISLHLPRTSRMPRHDMCTRLVLLWQIHRFRLPVHKCYSILCTVRFLSIMLLSPFFRQMHL